MTGELVVRQTALVLPDETQFRQDIQAINRFQAIVHQNLVPNQDYGIIPGTTKPTLLKPGAEKIAKLLGLSDQYEIVDRQEDWGKPFFRYLIKCKLIHIASQGLVSEGLGECNSMESKYRWRWLSERDLPGGIDKTKLVTQVRKAKTGGHWIVFRFENDEIFSQVNTILKMAKKRALVDAALSAGRLSNVFTQDIEDITPAEEMAEGTVSEAVEERRTVNLNSHYCPVHKVNFYKRGKMRGFAHPYTEKIGDDEVTKWCNEPSEEKTTTDTKPTPSPERTESVREPVTKETSGNLPKEQETTNEQAGFFNIADLTEKMKVAKFLEKTVLSWLRSKANYRGLDFSGNFTDILSRMSKEQAEFLMKEIDDRAAMR